jgi:hypothetical protein
MLRRVKQVTLATALAASAVVFGPAAHAERVDFNVAIGGPGYALAFGNAPHRGAVAWRPYGYRGDDGGPHYVRPRWHPEHASRPVGYVVSAYAPPVGYVVSTYAPPVGYVVSTYAPPVVYAPRVVYLPHDLRPPRIAYRGPYLHRPFTRPHRDHRGDRDRD